MPEVVAYNVGKNSHLIERKLEFASERHSFRNVPYFNFMKNRSIQDRSSCKGKMIKNCLSLFSHTARMGMKLFFCLIT